jgi:hypothetical protein
MGLWKERQGCGGRKECDLSAEDTSGWGGGNGWESRVEEWKQWDTRVKNVQVKCMADGCPNMAISAPIWAWIWGNHSGSRPGILFLGTTVYSSKNTWPVMKDWT